MPHDSERRVFAALAAGFLATFLLFTLWPGLDIAASRLFFDPATGTFALNGHPLAEALRRAIWDASVAVLAAALLALCAALLLRRPVAGLPARAWGFVVALYALGPGLLVETLLKGHWGRARPADIAEFGGLAQYTPPWLPTDQCLKNCSFVAGEAAGAAALALSLGLALLWWRGRIPMLLWRALAGLAVAAPLVAAAQRLGAGRHFLSDILCAVLLIGLAAAVLARILHPLPAAPSGPVDKPRDSSY